MKLIIIISFVLISISNYAQGFDEFVKDSYYSERPDEEVLKQLNNIIELIKFDRVIELSERVAYPLKKMSPLPDINTRKEFILYYPILFDSALKVKLSKLDFDSTNTVYYQPIGWGPRGGTHYRLGGKIWFYKGKITAIHFQSKKELELLNNLNKEIKSILHESVVDWKKNEIICETEKFLIRIDYLEDRGYRYISWGRNKKISEKPDLILYNGEMEYHGTDGGESYTFKNADWTYVIDNVKVGKGDGTGLFLKIYQNDIEKANYRSKELDGMPFDMIK